MSKPDHDYHEIEVLVNQNEGPKDLSRRFHELVQNRQAMGKPNQEETAFKQVMSILKKVFQGAIKYEKLESCLQILADIASTSPKLFVYGETHQFVFSKIIAQNCSETQAARRSSIVDIILADIATAIFEVDETGEKAAKDYVEPCLRVLADAKEHLSIRKEAAKFLNIAIASFMRSNGELHSVPFVENFNNLLVTAGDLEVQLCMTELIFRLLSPKKRESYANLWFQQNPECYDDFMSIRDAEFESDCRAFLNNLNGRQLENRSVYSISCKKVYLGMQKVECPSDNEDGTFWTDFNMGSKSISFFAFEKESDTWLTVIIKQKSVLKTQMLEKKESQEILLLIQLNEPAHTLLPFLNPSEEKYVKLIYAQNNSPVTPASLLFPSDYASNTPPSPDVISSTPKASVTSSAIQLSSRSKGLSKTVSLLTSRRKKGESSDDSSKSVRDKSENKKAVPKKKETSRQNTKGNNTQKKDSQSENEKKQGVGSNSGKTDVRDTVGTDELERKQKEAEEVKSVPAVAHDEGSRTRTRSSRSSESVKNHGQTEKAQGEQGNDIEDKSEGRKSEANKSVDESELGKSVDSGLGKSVGRLDPTVDSKNEVGHGEYLKDASQDEPTVIHSTQSLTQNENDDDTRIDGEVTSKDQNEDPVSVISKPRRADDDTMDAKKTAAEHDDDSSSGPFFKGKVSKNTTKKDKTSKEDEGELSTAFKTKPTKPVNAKSITKTRPYRTRAAAKLSSISTSESEPNAAARKIKARLKSAESGSKNAKARTLSADDVDRKHKLGTGYNTEDWMFGWSDFERRAGKKKALQNPANSSRLSLIDTVYRAGFRSDYKRKKLSGPFEFKCSPPAKRTPQGKRLLRPAQRAYQLRKREELQRKRKKHGKEKEPKAYEETERNEPSFSDIALEAQRKHREREQAKHHSEGEVLNRATELEVNEQVKIDVVDENVTAKRHTAAKFLDEKGQNEEVEKETPPAQVEEEASPFVPADESIPANFGDQQVDITAGQDQETFDESLQKLLKVFSDDNPSAGEENVGRNDIADVQDKPGTVKDKKEELVNKERDDEVAQNRTRKDKDNPRINGRTSASISGNPAKRSARDNGVKSKSKENNDDDDEERGTDLNKPQVDRSRAQRKTKSRANFNKQEILTRDTEQVRGKQDDRDEANVPEIGENREEEGCTGRRRKQMPSVRKFAAEDNDGKHHLSSDTSFIVNAFSKNLERIIEDSDDCMDRLGNADKPSSSRRKSETISRNILSYSKSSRDIDLGQWEKELEDGSDGRKRSTSKRRQSSFREEHLYHPHEPLRFETPKGKPPRSFDSGFFDKTGNSKKRSYDQRNETPGSAKSDVRDKTPGGRVTRRCRHFGRIAMQSSGSPRRGYQSTDDKRTPRLQGEHQSSEEDGKLFSRSQPARSSTQGTRKRKGTREADGSTMKESKAQQHRKTFDNFADELDGEDYAADAFKTPGDNKSIPIQPKKLFRSSEHPTAQKRRKISRERRENDEDDDDGTDGEDMSQGVEADDASYVGDEMRTSFVNLRNEVRKTVKLRQDYVTQMAAATMKFVSAKSEEIWSKQSSRRNALMNEFKNRMNKYMEEDRQIMNRQQQIENEMFTQVKNHLEDLATQRKEHEKCVRGITKTQKIFIETFKSIEDAEQSQQMEFYDSLRKELKRYRDQAAKEVEKQEFENIKRRIQAMLGISL